ncbi:hypothetical protein SO802_015323 [Lithocarpus litseifolius]|uniref:Reverse transcriptase zinc-binding domain-containing protein n=1 Tax=Lithocarpus litseifolius TaxID=425828 RepID=A0AAW2CTY6_9ROSI
MENLATPLQQDGSLDTLIWKETKSGSFSVKSAYKVVIRMRDTIWVEHSSARKDGTFWRRLWRLNVSPKVRMFLWRACSNILPTRENLNKRRVQVDPMCEVNDVEKRTVTAWAIWNARNKYYFEWFQLHPRDILRGQTVSCKNTRDSCRHNSRTERPRVNSEAYKEPTAMYQCLSIILVSFYPLFSAC